MESSSKKLKIILSLVSGLLFVVGLVLAWHFLDGQEKLKDFLTWIEELGDWAPVIFACVYILTTIAFIPGSILTLGAGILFGVLWGTAVVSIASVTGASAAFLIGRHWARQWVKKKIDKNKKFKAVDEAVGKEGWKIVLLTRLSPAFPFNFLNYAFGLTPVKFKSYFFGSWVGMLPGTIMYVYLGSVIGDIATLGTVEREKSMMEWSLYGVGLFATVGVVIFVTRKAKKILNNKIE